MGQLPKPLSPEELKTLNQKARGPQVAVKPATAAEVAYATGIKDLGPVVQRIETLEKQVKALEGEIALLLAAEKPAAGALVGTSTGALISPLKLEVKH